MGGGFVPQVTEIDPGPPHPFIEPHGFEVACDVEPISAAEGSRLHPGYETCKRVDVYADAVAAGGQSLDDARPAPGEGIHDDLAGSGERPDHVPRELVGEPGGIPVEVMCQPRDRSHGMERIGEGVRILVDIGGPPSSFS